MCFSNLKKYFTATFLLICLGFSSKTSTKKIFFEKKVKSEKEILNKQNNFQKIDEATKFLETYNKTHSPGEEDSKAIIDYVFKAQKSAEKFDKINTESDFFFKKAIYISRQKDYKDFEIWANLNFAYYLYSFNKYEECYPYFMFCIKKLDDINPEDVINPIDTYKKISYFFVTANENDLAINYLKKAEKISKPQSLDMATIKDVLGLCYLNKNQLLTAKQYFEDALLISSNIKDQLREAKALGNLAEVDFRNENYSSAIIKLNADIAISEKNHNDQNSMFALIKLCKFYLKINKVSKAEATINLAEKYAYSKPYFKSSLYEINQFLLEIAKRQGNVEEELKVRRTIDALADSLKTLDGQDVINSVGWKAGRKTLEYKINLEKNKYEKEYYLNIIACLISGVLIIAVVLIVMMARKKIKTTRIIYEKNLLTLKLEKLISENKLNSKTKSLLSYRNYLLEKISQIQELEAELNKTQAMRKNKKDDYALKLDDLLKSHLLTAENWNNFKVAFAREKPIYSKYLEVNFPHLTEANLRVIYLSQLELNNTEIARILGVTLFAVKKAKQRLRLKYKDDYDKLFDLNT